MKLRVVISNQQSSSSNIQEFSSAYCLVGRKNSTLVIEDPRCSQQHLLLFEGPDGRLWMRDLESTNGTFINGKRSVETAINVGDSIRIGKTTVVVLAFTPAKEGSFTHASTGVTNPSEERTEVQEIIREKRKKKNPELLNRWPENIKASPRAFQERFVDYVDEQGTMTRIRLKDLLKAA